MNRNKKYEVLRESTLYKIASRAKHYRRAHNFSIKKVTEKIGCSFALVQQFEAGKLDSATVLSFYMSEFNLSMW